MGFDEEMNFIRLIIWAILIYLFYLFYKKIFKKNSAYNNGHIAGTPKKGPLDLSDYDVEDADFEELDED